MPDAPTSLPLLLHCCAPLVSLFGVVLTGALATPPPPSRCASTRRRRHSLRHRAPLFPWLVVASSWPGPLPPSPSCCALSSLFLLLFLPIATTSWYRNDDNHDNDRHPAPSPLVAPSRPSCSLVGCYVKLAGAPASLPLLLRFVVVVFIVVFAHRHDVAVWQQQRSQQRLSPGTAATCCTVTPLLFLSWLLHQVVWGPGLPPSLIVLCCHRFCCRFCPSPQHCGTMRTTTTTTIVARHHRHLSHPHAPLVP